MAFSICIRRDGRAPEEASESACNLWFTTMFQTHPPPGWIAVPCALLPAHTLHAYFHACAFAARPGSELDTRPLISWRLRTTNPLHASWCEAAGSQLGLRVDFAQGTLLRVFLTGLMVH